MDRTRVPAHRVPLLAACLAVLAATAAVHLPSASFSFLPWDDDLYVTANPLVLRGLTAQGVAEAFTTFRAGNWHPLAWISHMADVSLFGLDAGRHHLVNAALHGANSLLLLAFLFRATGAFRRSLLAAALFALHPLHVEPVAWVSERKELLCALFLFLALLAYLRYAARPSGGRMAVVAVAYSASLLSKPASVTLPFALLLLDYWPLRRLPFSPSPGGAGIDAPLPVRESRALLAEKVPLLLLSAASCVVTLAAQRGGRMITPLSVIPLPLRAANALSSYGFYLKKAFLPTGLAAYYPYPYGGIPWHETAAWAALLAAVTAVAVRERSRRPWLPVGWFWFLGTLVPTIGLVQVSEQAAADRYAYLPLAGILLALSWGAGEAAAGSARRRRAVTAAAAAVLLLLVPASRRQAGYWKDGETLFRRALAVTRDNHVAMVNLGAVLGPDRSGEAMALFREALRIRPGYAAASYNLGYELCAAGRPGEALPHFLDAIRSDPSLDRPWNDVGRILLEGGNAKEGERWFREALRRNPSNADARANLGLSAELAGRYGEARSHYLEALRLRPDDARAAERLAGLEGKEGGGGDPPPPVRSAPPGAPRPPLR